MVICQLECPTQRSLCTLKKKARAFLGTATTVPQKPKIKKLKTRKTRNSRAQFITFSFVNIFLLVFLEISCCKFSVILVEKHGKKHRETCFEYISGVGIAKKNPLTKTTDTFIKINQFNDLWAGNCLEIN